MRVRFAAELLWQPQKAFVWVSNCTWTSSPMTGSYRAITSGETLVAVAIVLQF